MGRDCLWITELWGFILVGHEINHPVRVEALNCLFCQMASWRKQEIWEKWYNGVLKRRFYLTHQLHAFWPLVGGALRWSIFWGFSTQRAWPIVPRKCAWSLSFWPYYVCDCYAVFGAPTLFLRKGLIAGNEYPFVAEHMSDYMTKTLNYISLLYCTATEHKRDGKCLLCCLSFVLICYCHIQFLIGALQMATLEKCFWCSHLKCFMQLLNSVGMWSYLGLLSRLFSLTITKYLNIIVDRDAADVHEDNILKHKVAEQKSLYCFIFVSHSFH